MLLLTFQREMLHQSAASSQQKEPNKGFARKIEAIKQKRRNLLLDTPDYTLAQTLGKTSWRNIFKIRMVSTPNSLCQNGQTSPTEVASNHSLCRDVYL